MPALLIMVLALFTWMAVALLALGLCTMAARGDAAPPLGELEPSEDVAPAAVAA